MRNEELIEEAVNALKDLEDLQAIILFGSYAKWRETSASDIDLMIVVDKGKPKKLLPTVIKKLSSIDKEGKISPRLTNLSDYESDFLLDVFRHGKLLYGKAILNEKKMMLKPYRLVYYDISDLPPSKKVLISKRIHGSESTVSNKKYLYKGIKDLYGFEVFRRSLVLVPEKSFGNFKVFLDSNNVKYREKKIWVE